MKSKTKKRKKSNKALKWIQNNKGKSILLIILVVIVLLGATYAYFSSLERGSEKTMTMGNLKIEYIDGETINLTNRLPILEEEVDDYASKTSFSIKNTGNLLTYAEISLLINDLPTDLNSEDFRYTLYREDEVIATGSFKNAGSKLILKANEEITATSTEVDYTVAIWIRENDGDQNAMLNETLNAKINVTAMDKRGEYAE